MMKLRSLNRFLFAGLLIALVGACAPSYRYQAAGPQGGDYYYGPLAHQFVLIDESPLFYHAAYFSLFWGVNRYAYHPFFHPGFHYGVSLYPRHYMAFSVHRGLGRFGPAWHPGLWYAGYYDPRVAGPWRPGWRPTASVAAAQWRARDEVGRMNRDPGPAAAALMAGMPAGRGMVAHRRRGSAGSAAMVREVAAQGHWGPREEVLLQIRSPRARVWVDGWEARGHGPMDNPSRRSPGFADPGGARGVPAGGGRSSGVSAGSQRPTGAAPVPVREATRQQER